MTSLSDLIFGSLKSKGSSNENSPLATQEESNPKRSASSILRETYQYDPLEDFYHRPSQSSCDDNIDPVSSTHERFDQNPLSVLTQITPKKGEKQDGGSHEKSERGGYDFQQNTQDREFYHSSSLSTATSLAQVQKILPPTKKRKKWYENETKEEHEERERIRKIVKARRTRFRNRKYNFDNEVDYGGSIMQMVKLQMDAEGMLKSTQKTKVPKSEVNEVSDNDNVDQELTNENHMNDNEDSRRTSTTKRKNDKNSDSDEEDDANQGGRYALGSLLDRVQHEEDEAIRQQQQIIKQELLEGDIDYKDDVNQMMDDPMSFTNHGYIAPLSKDPNKQLYSYNNSSSNRKLDAVRTNVLFCKEQMRSQQKFMKSVTNKSKLVSKHTQNKIAHIMYSQKNYIAKNSMIRYKFLPLNCFNPTLASLQSPTLQDIYHYLPFSRQDPTSMRMNTNKDYHLENLISPFDEKLQFYEKPSKKSFNPIHFHSRNIHLFAARIIVSCSGIKQHSNDRNTNDLSRILETLYRKKSTSFRTAMIVMFSQEMASNYAMFKCLERRIEHLLTTRHLDQSGYHFIKKELLSSQSEMLCDPCIPSTGLEIRGSTIRKRTKLLNFIRHLERIKSLEPKSDDGDSTTIDCDEDPTKSTYSIQYAKKCLNNDYITAKKSEKFAQVIHKSEIDIDTVRLTLSIFYSELSRHRLNALKTLKHKGKRSDIKSEDEDQIHQSIMAYLDKIENEIWYIGNDSETVGNFSKGFLNGPLAHVVLMKQSCVANSGFRRSDINNDDHDKVGGNDKIPSINFASIADEMYSLGSNLCGDVKLTAFTGIHLTTGIAMLAKSMPSYAAEIISRPYGIGQTHQSPISLMQLALEEMEQKGHISRNRSSSMYNDIHDSSISVDFLVASFNAAADLFQDCVDKEIDDLDCMSWLLTTRIASMLMGSGIIIGAGPCIAAPPIYEASDKSQVRHADYSKQRAIASSSFRELISWQSKGSQGSRYHFIIKTCLEWKEIVFLLLHRPLLNQNFFAKVRSLHASHLLEWAIKEPSEELSSVLLSLHQNGLVSNNGVLLFLSALVESDASCVKYWVMLSFALGPLGSSRHKCKRNVCSECNQLRKGGIRHKKTFKMKRKYDWWGFGKMQWWYSQYFIFPPSKNTEKVRVTVRVRRQLSEKIESSCAGKLPVSILSSKSLIFNKNLTDISWAWNIEPSEEDEEDHLISESESEFEITQKSKPAINQQLPQHDPKKNIEINSKCVKFIDDLGFENALLASKILVASHLYGSDDVFVKSAVYYLLKLHLLEKAQPKPFNALCFLASQNLNVSSYFFGIKDRRTAISSAFPFNFAIVK